MPDYNDIFQKWVLFFESPKDTRNAILGSLNKETKAGFNVITGIAMEEMKMKIDDPEIIENTQKLLPTLIAFSIFGGYVLHHIALGIDPITQELSGHTELQEVGNIWIQHQKNDGGKTLVSQIDPIILMVLEKAKQARMNQLLMNYQDIVHKPHRLVMVIEKFIIWSSVQGYALAMIEDQMLRDMEIVKDLV